jgi:hypothetical protein
MFNKSKLFVAGAILTMAASSAMAASKHAAVTHQFGRDATSAYAQSQATAAPRTGHVIVDGQDQGWDPDPLVRLKLLTDPPHGN